MIDMYGELETVPADGGKPLPVSQNRRYWPNNVSLEYCARIRMPGSDREEEHWYDDEGQPLDPRSPAIRNVRQITAADLKSAFLAGAGNGVAMSDGAAAPTFGEAERRFEVWFNQFLGVVAETLVGPETIAEVDAAMTGHTGYSELRAALDNAHSRPGVNNTVRVTMAGDNAACWDLVTGDHVERDGSIHLGNGVIVLPDSTVAGTGGGLVRSCGGHIMGNGDALARFTLDGVATTLEWKHPTD